VVNFTILFGVCKKYLKTPVKVNFVWEKDGGIGGRAE
jgi:hypothetical protein